MTTTNQTTYKTGTAAELLATTEPAGTLAFATDTKHLMISNGTTWILHAQDREIGSTYSDGTYQYPGTPILHFDVSETTSLQKFDGTQASQGDTVERWTGQTDGLEFRCPQHPGAGPKLITKNGNAGLYFTGVDSLMRLEDPLKLDYKSGDGDPPVREMNAMTVIGVVTYLSHPYGMTPQPVPTAFSDANPGVTIANGIGLYHKRFSGDHEDVFLSTNATGNTGATPEALAARKGTREEIAELDPYFVLTADRDATGAGIAGRYSTPLSVAALQSAASHYRVFMDFNATTLDSANFQMGFWSDNGASEHVMVNGPRSTGNGDSFSSNDTNLGALYSTRDWETNDNYTKENALMQHWHWNQNFLDKPQVFSTRIEGRTPGNDASNDIFQVNTHNRAYQGGQFCFEGNGEPFTVKNIHEVAIGGLKGGIGKYQPTTTQRSDVVIHELIVFPSKLSSTSLQSLGDHLKTKWGLDYFSTIGNDEQGISLYDANTTIPDPTLLS